jgi:hypothetical protein
MAQSKRKKEGIMKEEMIVEDMVIPGVLVELIDTTHLLTKKEGLMHLKMP